MGHLLKRLPCFNCYQPVFLVLLTKNEFDHAVTHARPENPFPRPTNEQYQNFINRAMSVGRIVNKRELAMFLANVLWESDGLQAREEYDPYHQLYQYPTLDQPGRRYHGRGYMQLTWSYNYRDASRALYGDDRLLFNPELVANVDHIAWDTAFWYWSSRVRNRPGVSEGHFGVTINAINGDLECNLTTDGNDKPSKRFQIYSNIYRTLGLPGRPSAAGCNY